jgi:excisionase family DNA binding protein
LEESMQADRFNSQAEKSPSALPRMSLRVDEAAATIGVSRSRVYELLKEGQLHGVKEGKSTLIPVREIQAMLDRLPAYQPRHAPAKVAA